LGGGSERYSCEDSFSMQLPSPVIPSGDVVIVTLNFPEGKVIPIEGLPPRGDSSDSSNKPPPNNQLVKRLAGTVDINVLFGEPFQIERTASVPKFGEVDIVFDPKYLTLTNARIEDSNLVWTFNSLQTGDTQAVTTVRGGIADFITQTKYNIRIFVLDAAPAPSPSDEILSFLGRVNIAVRIVQEKYESAELYEVDATLPRGDPNPTSSPLTLSQLRAIFRVEGGTVIIRSTGWGSWGQPKFVPSPWLECVVIPWPITMDITDATTILREGGYTADFWNCTLRHPLGPPGKPYDEPYYIFEMVSGEYVFVGVNDGVIYVNSAGQPLLPEKTKVLRI